MSQKRKEAELKKLKARQKRLLALYNEVTEKINNLTLIGYRNSYPGDDYNYGGQQDYLIEVYGTRKKALEAATRSAREGHPPRPVFEHSPPPGRIS
jgi:hypothetical protein